MHLIEGQKGGSKKQHKPYEQPDNLLSTAKLKALIALSEGEIQGDITEQNIYIDNTPLANADGSRNFNGVTWEFRNGSQTQDYIKGIPEISNELRANYIVKANKPWVRSFSNLDLDAIRIKLSLPTLVQYKDNGDIVGTIVNYAIDLSTDGSAFETVVNAEFNGKTTSEYQRDHRINLPSAVNGWAIRVRRLTPDSNSNSKLINAFGVSSYAEVIDSKLRYPNTALLYIELDASQFNGAVPKISCKLKGKLVQVPDNYDPVSRTYLGAWRGGFKMAYTNNPAWLAYYLMRDEIAGMGLRIDSTMLDKWSIYQLGQYCDQMVSDGKGGKEPRFACNEYIQSQEDAYTVLKDLVASFRGIIFWGNDQICLTADMPQDEPDFIYHPSNVIGDFAYSGGSYKNRYTSCLVAYSDPNNHYCDDVEAVWDYDLMRRYDVNVMKLTAIGCTSQAEAQRRGRWALLSNAKDEVITFTVGLDGYIPMPARIIGVADPSRSGKENGGRIHAVSGRKITLDRAVDYGAGDRLVINLPDGTAQSRTIKAISTDKKTITVSANYKIEPVVGAVWCIDSDNIAIQYFRVTSISATEKGQFTITAIQHDPDKFKYIDEGVRIESKPITVTPPSSISTPKNIVISESSYISQGLSIASLNATWDTVEGATNYVAQWRKDNSAWINVGRTNGTNFTVEGIYSGVYDVRVRAVNAIDVSSPWAYSQATSIKGKVGKPDKPIGFTASDDVVFGVDLKWSFPDGSGDTSHTEIQYSTNESEEKALLLSNVTYPSCSYSQTGLSIGQVFFYRARLVDKIGNVSDWTEWVRGISSINTNDLTDHIFDEIKETDAWNSLIDSVDNAAISSIENAKAIIENALANDVNSKKWRKTMGNVSVEIKETKALIASEHEATAIELNEISSTLDGAKANIDELKKTTIKQGELIESQSGTLTHLSSSIDNTNKSVKNNVSALNQMSTKVTQQGEKISAQADAINSINTNIGEVSTQVTDVSKAIQDTNGKLSAYRTMKVQVDNKGQQYVAGMTMGVENTDNGMQSNVIFLQDRFSIMNAAGGDPQVIFTTHGNQVIINDTAIGKGSITDAHIKDGSITNAKISNIIQSDNYVDGKKGWQLSKETGALKAVNADISGKLRATSGELNNVVINENCQIKGTLNVGQIKGNVLSAKNYVRDVYLGFNLQPPQNSAHIMTVEGNGCWQTLCFVGPTGVECSNGNVSEVTLQFLFNNQLSFNINQLINDGKIDNLYLPIPPFPLGSRVDIQLIGERHKHSFVNQCKVSFNSLALLTNNSNGFLD
ncbi:DUF1983 domain-containing protein [Gilliamella sp. Pra-s65]|uniref:TipJ family phage tail tip protein n=1 Tax=unclassified Gilliamella TaxID=2685620 RepID=UPI001365EC6B|nr:MULTISPECIES: DUF1983 domain-containing protein [unclassified Gilliamella]MWN91249.1 DUF1983 domain-containing protein [Gilliamella sp. Pra-s65]MWP74225.1 DUF1983 domain-containing protein [Gilliamella sp. Pra-s52]